MPASAVTFVTSTLTTVATSRVNMAARVSTPRSHITAHAHPDIPVPVTNKYLAVFRGQFAANSTARATRNFRQALYARIEQLVV